MIQTKELFFKIKRSIVGIAYDNLLAKASVIIKSFSFLLLMPVVATIGGQESLYQWLAYVTMTAFIYSFESGLPAIAYKYMSRAEFSWSAYKTLCSINLVLCCLSIPFASYIFLQMMGSVGESKEVLTHAYKAGILLIVIVNSISLLFSSLNTAVLQARGRHNLANQVSIVFGAIFLLMSVIVFFLHQNVTALIVTSTVLAALNSLVLAIYTLKEPLERSLSDASPDGLVQESIKNGLGIALYQVGLNQLVGLLGIKLSVSDANSFLLAFNIVRVVGRLSNVFITTKVRKIAESYESKSLALFERMFKEVHLAVGVSYTFYCLGSLLFLKLFGESFGLHVSYWAFSIVATAFFVERTGAIFQQKLIIAGRVKTLLANGVAGVFFISISLALNFDIFLIGQLSAGLILLAGTSLYLMISYRMRLRICH